MSAFSQFHYMKNWDHRYGGIGDDKLEMFHETSDKGFILGGTSYSDASFDKTESSRGQSDYWIVKTDSFGIMQWNKTFGGDNYDDLRDVRQTYDGGFILAGSSRSQANGDKSEPNWDNSAGTPTHDYWIVKTDAQGNKLWDKRYGGIYSDLLTAVTETRDHGFLLGGFSEGNATGDRTENSRGGPDYWIVRTDEFGNKIWDKRFGGNRNDQLWSVAQTKDGGFILGGFSWSDSSGDKTVNNYGLVSYSDYWIVKIDSLGNKQWDNHYGGTANEYLYSIRQTSDDGYVLGGPSWSDSTADKTSHNFGPPNTSDYWIIKLTSTGILQWDKSFGGVNHEDEYGNALQMSDNGYLVSGTSYSGISGNKSEQNLGIEQSWVVKTDLAGNIMWDKTILTNGHDERGLALETSDGGIAVANYTNGGIGGYKSELNRDSSNITYDYWLIRYADTTRKHPSAALFTSSRNVCPKTCIDFLNMSLNATSFKWLFPGASPSSSTAFNPGNICYNTPGTWNVTLIASDSVESDTIVMQNYITVFSNPPPLTIVQSNDTLFSPDVFSTYQWSRNGNPIQGANDFFLVITTGGIYDVDVTDTNGCASNHEINAIMAGIKTNIDGSGITVYPNPTADKFSVTFESVQSEQIEISLINSIGEKIFIKEITTMPGTNKISIPINNFSKGIYYIVLTDSNKSIRKPFIIIP